MSETMEINGATIRQIVKMCGVDLSLEHALLIESLLREIFVIDQRIADMNLGTLSPLSTPWMDEANNHE